MDSGSSGPSTLKPLGRPAGEEASADAVDTASSGAFSGGCTGAVSGVAVMGVGLLPMRQPGKRFLKKESAPVKSRWAPSKNSEQGGNSGPSSTGQAARGHSSCQVRHCHTAWRGAEEP